MIYKFEKKKTQNRFVNIKRFLLIYYYISSAYVIACLALDFSLKKKK